MCVCVGLRVLKIILVWDKYILPFIIFKLWEKT